MSDKGIFISAVTEVRLLQPANAEPPISVSTLGKDTEVRLLQPTNLEVTDYQLFVVNTEEKRIGFYV